MVTRSTPLVEVFTALAKNWAWVTPAPRKGSRMAPYASLPAENRLVSTIRSSMAMR